MQLKGLHHRDGFHLCIQHNPKQHTHTNAVWWFQASLNTVTAKLTNHFQRTRLITPSTDMHYLLDSEDGYRSGCRSVSHQ